MNERDSEQVAQMLVNRGHTLTTDERAADVILLNTCSVRDQAEQKALGKMATMGYLRRERPHVVFGFLGCMAQSRGVELLRDVPHTDLVVGTQKFHRVADHVEQLLEHRRNRQFDDPRTAMVESIVDVEEEDGSQNTIRDHRLKKRQATAFVSIMQGCNMSCSYCIVPHTRGSERSRPIDEIVSEVTALVAQGVREVTLLGQIVNLYGRHEFEAVDGLSPFVRLLDAVHAIPGLARLRFTSPHPQGFRDDLVGAFARLPKLCSHIHLPLQSGSDRILRGMRRTYTAAKYLRLVEKLREARPGLALTTDIIVGFPGETEEEYLQTRAMADEIGFDNAFVFRYSPRRDTPAAILPEQLPEEVKEWRNQDLLSVVDRHAKLRCDAWVGSDVEVLCEGPSRTNELRLSGRTSEHKIVVFEGPDRLAGEFVNVRIAQSSGFTLYGDVVVGTAQIPAAGPSTFEARSAEGQLAAQPAGTHR